MLASALLGGVSTQALGRSRLAGETVLAEAVNDYRAVFGARLQAAYALGSLAHGGFSPLVSDIDLGLVVVGPTQPSDAAKIQAVADLQQAGGSELRQRLSVFWGTPAILRGEESGGRFPAVDRLDLIKHGRLLSGNDDARHALPRPQVEELLIGGAEFALDMIAPDSELDDPDRLLARGTRTLTKSVLFPVRFLFTADTGQVAAHQAAVARHLADPGAPSAELVEAALTWRTAPPADRRAVSRLLRAQLLPLYLHYIAHHVTRLRDAGRDDLAAAFKEWGARLS